MDQKSMIEMAATLRKFASILDPSGESVLMAQKNDATVTVKPTVYGTPPNREEAIKYALEKMGWGPEEAGQRHEGNLDWQFMQHVYEHERLQQEAKPAPFGRYGDGTPREDPNANHRVRDYIGR